MALVNLRPHCPIPSLRSPKNSSSSPRISCFSIQSKSFTETTQIEAGVTNSKKEYKPGVFDDVFLNVFRSKMAQEIGWDSEKPGYDGLIDVAHRIMAGRSNTEATEAAVRILVSLFPPLLLELYKLLISPIAGGKVAALMVARVTAISCQWLMGPCAVNSVDLPDKSSWSSGVFVEKCKYLEESKCVGVCINTCKLPTQFNFGVLPPPPEEDSTLKQPCLEVCPTANRRKEIGNAKDVLKCPKS
ncbi:beta-carotene isomerase D27, chloroplastic isoform X2 [Henckelia pumila]|uniref:beta-carotene isomerase D27, chloroplastic isoform X2 n=1 Tax=Henckelia pumila TaxID=405737 RepID=UPI003C6DCAC6